MALADAPRACDTSKGEDGTGKIILTPSASGADIEFVSKLSGHSVVRVTSGIYSHLLQSTGREHADRAAALVPRLGAVLRSPA